MRRQFVSLVIPLLGACPTADGIVFFVQPGGKGERFRGVLLRFSISKIIREEEKQILPGVMIVELPYQG